MEIFNKLKQRHESHARLATEISDEVNTFTQRILSHDVFNVLKGSIEDIINLYEKGEAIHLINEALLFEAGAHRQTEYEIKTLPPEGIIIDKSGRYTFSPGSDSLPGSAPKLTWSPTSKTAAAAINIIADDVILDMGDNTLFADIQDSSRPFVGIYVLGAKNVTIRNGTLANMALYGIQAKLVEQFTISNINVTGQEYHNTKIRNASPAAIQIRLAKQVEIQNCHFQYLYTSADSASAVQLFRTIGATLRHCSASHIYNYAGAVEAFFYLESTHITTEHCSAHTLQSHFGGNIRTGGHTVLGFLPTLCYNLEFAHCTAENITGSCDDCHGMSVFLNIDVKVTDFYANNVTDGVTQFNTGAKATGLEVYGVNVQLKDCTVENIKAINPQDKLSTGFSVWGVNIELSNCTAKNISVSNNLDNKELLMGTGTGFGWAPDPRLYHTGAINVIYKDCCAVNCQVGFDTWNHIKSEWINPSSQNCAIHILVEPGGKRTLYGDPCTECNPPVAITLHNQADNNVFPGSMPDTPPIRYAYPTGNINALSLPYALSRLNDVNAQWWFYVGLVQDDQNQDHSFELTFIEPGGVLGETGLTAVDFDFTFTSQGEYFHATSTYGGNSLDSIIQSIKNVVGFSQVTSQNDDFSIRVNSLSGTMVKVAYDPNNSQSGATMFTGQPGQPGGAYTLEGQGTTWLWRYHDADKERAAPYQYSLKLQLLDERGLVPEGLGSYVGVDPIHPGTKKKNSSVEYAQPRLRVVGWAITLTRFPENTIKSWIEDLEGFAERYIFQGKTNSGQIWLDRQALFNAPTMRHSQGRALLSEALKKVQKTLGSQQMLRIIDDINGHQKKSLTQYLSRIVTDGTLNTAILQQSQQLYVGCWLPLMLENGPYSGATLLFVAFWNKAKSIADYDTDAGDAKPNSFMNLYTGLLGTNGSDPQSAYTLSDLLNPVDAVSPSHGNTNNAYRIHFTEQFQRIGSLPDPQRWASEIEVTVKALSQARYALAAYAKRAGQAETSGVDQDLTFIIKAVSPYTHTTTLSSTLGAPIYEGASRIYDTEGNAIGSGWIEQMVGAPK